MHFMFKDPVFSEELKKVLGYAASGGADIGECIATATTIKDSDFQSWQHAWFLLATKIAAIGDKAIRENNSVSAYQAYLRAASYYRAAFFFLRDSHTNATLHDYLTKQTACFQRAMSLATGYTCTPIEIPYQDKLLPGYWYKPHNQRFNETDAPLVIITHSYENTAEEMHNAGALAAVKRGYQCITFDGPGQGRALYERALSMQPDWHTVIAAVIDFATVANKGIDHAKITLIGRGFGGYNAAQAATQEHRIAALVVNPGMTDLGEQALGMLKALPVNVQQAFFSQERQEAKKNLVDSFFSGLFSTSRHREFFFKSRMFAHGFQSPYDYLHALLTYTLKDTVHAISCPTAIVDAVNQNTQARQSQAHVLAHALQCPTTSIVFSQEEGAGQYCQPLAPLLAEQRIFDWLNGAIQSISNQKTESAHAVKQGQSSANA